MSDETAGLTADFPDVKTAYGGAGGKDANDGQPQPGASFIPAAVASRRSLFVVVSYLAGGVLVYSLGAGFSPLDALYFCMVTLTTVGYGDLTSETDGTKLFACVYILMGVCVIGSALSHMLENIVAKQEAMFADALLKRKFEERRMSARVPFLTESVVEVLNSVLMLLLVMILGVTVFTGMHGMSVVDSIYLVVVSASTVGYGDYYPVGVWPKLFAIIFLPLSTVLLVKVVGDYTEMKIDERREAMEHAVLMESVGRHFSLFDVNNDGRIDRLEYLSTILIRQQKVTREEIDGILERFDVLDVNRDGTLERGEVDTV